MSTQGRKTFKAQIRIGDGESPEVFTKIDEMISMGPVGGKKTLINMSSNDTVGFEDFEVFDLKEGNELQCECIDIVDNTSQGLVRTADDDSSKDNWQVLDRNGKGWQFLGLVMGTEVDYSNMRDKILFRWTLKVCSQPTAVTVSL